MNVISNQTTTTTTSGGDVMKGYDVTREVVLLTLLALGLILNLLAFVALKKLVKTNGHYIIVMGLISSNIVCNVTLLSLIPMTVRRRYDRALFVTMFPLSLSTYFASVSHIVCISIERLVAVAKPLFYRRLFSNRRMKAAVASIWLVALTSHLIIVFANVNPEVTTKLRKVRFVIFSPYLMTYYTSGLVLTFLVYIYLLICLSCVKKKFNSTVMPLKRTVSCSSSSKIRLNETEATDLENESSFEPNERKVSAKNSASKQQQQQQPERDDDFVRDETSESSERKFARNSSFRNQGDSCRVYYSTEENCEAHNGKAKSSFVQGESCSGREINQVNNCSVINLTKRSDFAEGCDNFLHITDDLEEVQEGENNRERGQEPDRERNKENEQNREQKLEQEQYKEQNGKRGPPDQERERTRNKEGTKEQNGDTYVERDKENKESGNQCKPELNGTELKVLLLLDRERQIIRDQKQDENGNRNQEENGNREQTETGNRLGKEIREANGNRGQESANRATTRHDAARNKADDVHVLRQPKTVVTVGLLIFVHLITGLATLSSYGVIGHNALSHPELFGVPILMTLTNSLFDPFFYVVSSTEVRRSLKQMFHCDLL